MEQMASERVCYVHCNFCNTILAVSVPCSSMLAIVTVRCGHCATVLSVNMGSFASSTHQQVQPSSHTPPPPPPPDNFLQQFQRQHNYFNQEQGESASKSLTSVVSLSSSPSSSPSSPNSSPPPSSFSFNKITATAAAVNLDCSDHEPPRTPPIRPPEKRQRVPSAYNKFIKEEIQRIKARNPEISHREAFSLAAKNWAHFPRLHFGLNLEGHTIPAEGTL